MVVVGTVVTRTVYEQRIGGFGLGRGQGRSDAVSESQLRSALDGHSPRHCSPGSVRRWSRPRSWRCSSAPGCCAPSTARAATRRITSNTKRSSSPMVDGSPPGRSCGPRGSRPARRITPRCRARRGDRSRWVPTCRSASIPRCSRSATSRSRRLPTGGPCRRSRQPAIQGGKHVALQIAARIEGRPTSPFVYKDKGSMATIGRHQAVTEFPNGAPIPRRGRLAACGSDSTSCTSWGSGIERTCS